MLIDAKGAKWYKGNLHTHTTNSDGAMTPQECIALYREKGYDFLALTDHWIQSETVESDDFLLLAGCEYDTGTNVQDGIFHVVSIGATEYAELPRTFTVQQAADAIRSVNGLAILAHPCWSMDRADQILAVDGLTATEIYNSVSGTPWNGRPYSGVFVDDLAAAGKLMPCVAADDAHFYNGDQTLSYIMLKADKLDRESVLNALRKGDFYATQGPDFSWEIQNGELIVHSSPVEEVVFLSDVVYADDRVTRASGCTEAHYQIKPKEHYVRFELRDAQGKMGWSSPIPVNQMK